MFEKATRAKFRFPYKGQISTEDLWDLSPEELNKVYQVLNRELKSAEEDSLLSPKKGDSELQLKVDVVKHIVNVKLQDIEARKTAADKKANVAKLNDLIARKEEESLAGKSVDELKAMRDSL